MAQELNEVTERIIGGAFTVANRMGSGFLEKVYENALSHELRKAGMRAEQQKRLAVHYDNVLMGEYIADLIVEETCWWKSKRQQTWTRRTWRNA